MTKVEHKDCLRNLGEGTQKIFPVVVCQSVVGGVVKLLPLLHYYLFDTVICDGYSRTVKIASHAPSHRGVCLAASLIDFVALNQDVESIEYNNALTR
jgi:hypothetical protein